MTLSLSKLMAVADKATDEEWHSTGGAIWIVVVQGGPECCGQPTPIGDCCGMPVDGRYQAQEQIASASDNNAAHIATFDPPTVKRLLAIAKAAAVFLDDCPIGDDDKPYVTDICNGTEFRALRAALEGVEP